MKNSVSIAALQLKFSENTDENVEKVEHYCRQAAQKGAQIILPSELFENHYFCKEENEKYFSWAKEVGEQTTLKRFQALSEELKLVIPVSFFEKKNQSYYNSIAIMDQGKCLGIYRKSHIPDGPGYEEKFYFRPGDTGFKSWDTSFAKIGVGICWDQWFPESARAMSLLGADFLFYPTAIGSEPHDPDLLTKDPWQRAMIGHSVCNAIPVIAANRIGNENGQTFYGHSFLTNHRGDKIQEADDQKECVLMATYSVDEIRKYRDAFGFFRDRRPELYSILLSPDGVI